jgi:molybdopterin-guanine dinucleotide biosynthesis protein A
MVQEKLKNGPNNIGVKTINIEFDKEDPFFNINTKEDLEKAEKILND